MKPLKARLTRPADAFLPAAFLAATLLGRDAIAFDLFLALLLAKLCALAAADGLRAAFALQPAMRYVQGSACAALIAQCVGGGIALLPAFALRLPAGLIACGTLLNIEHIFYEYMVAVGDGGSATAVHGIAAALALLGMLLGCPPGRGAGDPSVFSLLPTVAACGLACLVGLFVSLTLGGGFRPKLNAEVLRRAPRALLEAALWPGLFMLFLLCAPDALDMRSSLPLFVGLVLIALCRTPFRRTPQEAAPMNRALLIAAGVALILLIPFLAGFAFRGESRILRDIPFALAAIPLSALCALALYGNLHTGNRYE